MGRVCRSTCNSRANWLPRRTRRPSHRLRSEADGATGRGLPAPLRSGCPGATGRGWRTRTTDAPAARGVNSHLRGCSCSAASTSTRSPGDRSAFAARVWAIEPHCAYVVPSAVAGSVACRSTDGVGVAGVCAHRRQELPVVGRSGNRRFSSPTSNRNRWVASGTSTSQSSSCPPRHEDGIERTRLRRRQTGRRRQPERHRHPGRPGTEQCRRRLPVRRQQHRHPATGAQAATRGQQRSRARGPRAQEGRSQRRVRPGRVVVISEQRVGMGHQRVHAGHPTVSRAAHPRTHTPHAGRRPPCPPGAAPRTGPGRGP